MAASRAPVRFAQSAALPTHHTISAGVIGMDNVGVLTIDGNAVVSLNDDVLVTMEGATNGVYTCTTAGDATHAAVLTRRSDLNSSAGFAGGVEIDVLDGPATGPSLAGTQWLMTTLGTIVPDSTVSTWRMTSALDRLEIDVTQAPYNVVPGQNSSHAGNWSDAINQAIADATAIGGQVRLPQGYIGVASPLFVRSGVRLRGAGKSATNLVPAMRGGAAIYLQALPPFPTTAAGGANTVDANSDFNLTFASGLTTGNCYWLNFTRAGFYIDANWGNAFNFQALIQYTSAGQGHLISCAGARHTAEAVSYTFSIEIVGAGDVKAMLTVGGTTRTLTTALSTKLQAGLNYHIALDYDGTMIRLWVTQEGQKANSNPNGDAHFSTTGTVAQLPFHETHLGQAQNGDLGNLNREGMFNGLLGSVRIGNTSICGASFAATTAPNSLSASLAGNKLFFRPSSDLIISTPNGLTPQGWEVVLGVGTGYAVVDRDINASGVQRAAVEELSIVGNGGITAVYCVNAIQTELRHLRATGVFDGFILRNNSFESTVEDLVVTHATLGRIGVAIWGASGVTTLHEIMIFGAALCYPLSIRNSGVHQTGKCYLTAAGQPEIFAHLNSMVTSQFDNLVIADENSTGSGYAGVFAMVGDDEIVSIHGNVECKQTNQPPFVICSGGAKHSGILTFAGRVRGGSAITEYFHFLDSNTLPVRLGNCTIGGAALGVPLSLLPDKVVGPLSAKSRQVAQVGSIGATTLLTSPPADLYYVDIYLECTTPGTAGTVVATVSYTDELGANTQSTSLALNALGRQPTRFLAQVVSGNISYSTTVTGAVGSPQYSITVRAERASSYA